METLERKKTIGQFSLDLLFECLEGSAKDVVLYCSDGQITFNRFYLSIISPVLFDILNNCLYNSLPEISVILPEFSRHEVKKLKKLCVDGYINKSSLSAWRYTQSLVSAKQEDCGSTPARLLRDHPRHLEPRRPRSLRPDVRGGRRDRERGQPVPHNTQ